MPHDLVRQRDEYFAARTRRESNADLDDTLEVAWDQVAQELAEREDKVEHRISSNGRVSTKRGIDRRMTGLRNRSTTLHVMTKRGGNGTGSPCGRVGGQSSPDRPPTPRSPRRRRPITRHTPNILSEEWDKSCRAPRRSPPSSGPMPRQPQQTDGGLSRQRTALRIGAGAAGDPSDDRPPSSQTHRETLRRGRRTGLTSWSATLASARRQRPRRLRCSTSTACLKPSTRLLTRKLERREDCGDAAISPSAYGVGAPVRRTRSRRRQPAPMQAPPGPAAVSHRQSRARPSGRPARA